MLLGFNSATRSRVTYYRPDGVKVAMATGANFTTELDNPIAEYKDGTTTEFWRGVDIKQFYNHYGSTNSCNGWRSTESNEATGIIQNETGSLPYYGHYGNYTYGDYWSNGWRDKCNNMKHLVCVAQ